MILENEDEKNAFEFIYELANRLSDMCVCNDLTKEDKQKFKHLVVDTDDNGTIIERPITFDFDVLYWLQKQIKFAHLLSKKGDTVQSGMSIYENKTSSS